MKPLEVLCPHCGHDFPKTADPAGGRRDGFAWSTLADLSLIVATFASAVSVFVSVCAVVIAFSGHAWLHALVIFPLSALISLGLLVVFLRVQEM